MSIPPLVCSTPPPPDQCEDEKVPGDFDFTYNTLQEDETNDFDYEEYSSCSVFQSPPTNMTITHEITLDNVYDVSNDITSKADNKAEKQDKGSISSNNLNFSEEYITKENCNYIADAGEDSKLNNNVNSKTHIEDISFEMPPVNTDVDISCQITSDSTKLTFNQMEGDEYKNEEIDTQTCILQETHEELNENKTFHEEVSSENAITNVELCHIECEKDTKNDDFGDFEDCQSIEPSRNSEVLFDECNPWEQNEPSDSGFGDFKANFDEPPSSENIKINPAPAVQENVNDDDDDFGDFDDFQSSSIAKAELNMQQDSAPQESTAINLPGNETHVINEINKVLTSMFSEEVPKPESSINGNLESLLCETWGHLMDVDERQPYIVPWNNCLGQKTLLKALCIDSRNILFGPKWSVNMPKYAATLNNAPLQPKKQVYQTNATSTESTHTDKSGTKPTTSWVDPFKSEGQESCTSEPESRPSDLGVFDAITTKPDKVYSETLGVQPIRQINLPDTHIFTPSDSETPRSKTIHYNSSPSVLLPQGVEHSDKEINIKQTENVEYSDFQDFTTFSSTADLASKDNQQPIENHIHMNKPESASNSVHGLQILQPIKIEPIIPTLNWPDPGEVKETFDDFADFVSSTSSQQDHHTKGSDLSAEKTNTNSFDSVSFYQKESLNTSRLDDFDTFQSAQPSKAQHEDILCNNNISSKTMSETTSQIQTSQGLFQKLSNNKSTHNTFLQDTMPQSMPLKVDSYDNGQDLSSSQPRTMVKINYSDQLQPTLASSTQNHQSHQILQPLSLESYSQINWPNPGIDLQDLSRFNPVETLHSLKSDIGVSGNSKTASPVHTLKTSSANQADEDVWGEFMSSKPKQQILTKKAPVFADDDEWTDFVSSPTVRPQNGLNTISLNVHTNLNMQKNSNLNKFTPETQRSLDIPSLNYITPKLSNNRTFSDKHFQNL